MNAPTAPHILVVDDDPDLRELLGTYLGANGMTVASAGDGAAMWLALEAGMPDAIVLDLMLPGEDGLALTRALRAKSSVPILMLSAPPMHHQPLPTRPCQGLARSSLTPRAAFAQRRHRDPPDRG